MSNPVAVTLFIHLLTLELRGPVVAAELPAPSKTRIDTKEKRELWP